MKTILTRLRRLENIAAPLEREQEIVKELLARRRRRLEESGEPIEDFIPVDTSGYRTLVEIMWAIRKAKQERMAQCQDGSDEHPVEDSSKTLA